MNEKVFVFEQTPLKKLSQTLKHNVALQYNSIYEWKKHWFVLEINTSVRRKNLLSIAFFRKGQTFNSSQFSRF